MTKLRSFRSFTTSKIDLTFLKMIILNIGLEEQLLLLAFFDNFEHFCFVKIGPIFVSLAFLHFKKPQNYLQTWSLLLKNLLKSHIINKYIFLKLSFAMKDQCARTCLVKPFKFCRSAAKRQQSWCHFYDFISFKICDKISCEESKNIV